MEAMLKSLSKVMESAGMDNEGDDDDFSADAF